MGVSRIGVSAAIPSSPYDPQIRTIRRVFLVNTFFFLVLLACIAFFTRVPRKVKKVTLVIIPKTLTPIISQGLYPAAAPSTGPAKNLTRQSK